MTILFAKIFIYIKKLPFFDKISHEKFVCYYFCAIFVTLKANLKRKKYVSRLYF